MVRREGSAVVRREGSAVARAGGGLPAGDGAPPGVPAGDGGSPPCDGAADGVPRLAVAASRACYSLLERQLPNPPFELQCRCERT